MKLAIITNKPYLSCETFIKAQIDHLPFDIMQYHGASLPLSREGSEIMKTSNLFSRVYHRFMDTKAGLRETVQMLKEDGIEVVLAEYGMVGTLVTEACRQLNIPLVVHFHGHDAVRQSILQKYGNAYLRMFSYATRIVSVSHVMTSKLVAIGCPEEKIVYNTYGPNDLFLAVTPEYSKRQIIGIGRFVEKKAPHLVIRAFAKVHTECPDVQLILAGDGPLLDSSRLLVEELGLKDHVDFPGIISPQEYVSYLTEALIFVQHSVTAPDGDMEGTPLSILEASGAGLPVVSTQHAGIPDVIIHGETGYLVEEKDVDRMADYIIALLQDEKLIRSMGQKGKENIKSHFSFSKHIDGLASVIQSANKS